MSLLQWATAAGAVGASIYQVPYWPAVNPMCMDEPQLEFPEEPTQLAERRNSPWQ
jgi:hypothetical protein